jgi:hypothetical protein
MIMELLAELRTLIARHAGGQAARQALPDIVLANLANPRCHTVMLGIPFSDWWRRAPSAFRLAIAEAKRSPEIA